MNYALSKKKETAIEASEILKKAIRTDDFSVARSFSSSSSNQQRATNHLDLSAVFEIEIEEKEPPTMAEIRYRVQNDKRLDKYDYKDNGEIKKLLDKILYLRKKKLTAATVESPPKIDTSHPYCPPQDDDSNVQPGPVSTSLPHDENSKSHSKKRRHNRACFTIGENEILENELSQYVDTEEKIVRHDFFESIGRNQQLRVLISKYGREKIYNKVRTLRRLKY